ncbi:MAG TPA: hypothetical protein VH331_13285 [Allosphingosinicella sp.]|jgi:hypothetical protein|nr:hypothetical protein [Allosphingosinicella sp.]
MSRSVGAVESGDPGRLPEGFETALWIPDYREGSWGPWSLRVRLVHVGRGYWGRLYGAAKVPLLIGPFEEHGAAWMSIVPMEIESQEIGIASAHGHTIVLGLGMGWCAANVALNPAVERVTVVEHDPDVLALVEAMDVFGQLPDAARAKIELVRDDALRWRPDSPVDSVQADIWARFVEPGKWDEARRIHDHIGAGSLYFWGQELELWRLACRARGRVPEQLEDGELEALIEQTGLPLVVDRRPDYPKRIAEAASWWAPREEGWWESR